MRRGEVVRIETRVGRSIAATAAVALVAIGLAACGGGSGGGGNATEGGAINVTMTSFPDYLDPQLSYTLEGWEVLYPTYTPLLTYRHAGGDPGTEVVPGLAEALPDISADGKTYKLTLRKGMKYSDGTPIKASDFKSTIERLFDVDSGGSVFYEGIVGAKEYADGKASSITGITADDATGAITIQLTDPNGTFPQVLALMFAAPVPPSTPDKDATNNPPPSSGPFMISSVDAPHTAVMVRNPQFKTIQDAGAKDVADAHVDKITITQNKSNTAQVTGVEQNNIDYMVDPPDADRLPEVKAKYSDRFRLEDTINTYYFWMNTQAAPFNDLKVRQAINYAVDPEALNRVFGGRLHPTQQILPPGMPGYQEYKLYPGPDMAKAKALLAEANPSDKDITVWTDDEPDRKRIGEYYQDLLNQLGFNAKLKIISGDVYFQTIGNEKTPNLDTGFSDWFQDFPHPDDFFRPLLNGENVLPTNSNNYSHVAIPALDKQQNDLLKQQLTDDVKTQYAALDKSYMQQAVWAPYGNEQFTTFVSDRLDFNTVYHHLLFNEDYTSFAIKG
jgi:peptide/nickel transport system substrate-binding protein